MNESSQIVYSQNIDHVPIRRLFIWLNMLLCIRNMTHSKPLPKHFFFKKGILF